MSGSIPISARILVVEDDPILQELIIRLVRSSGHEAVSANTGEKAISILRGEPVDWLITDSVARRHRWMVGGERVYLATPAPASDLYVRH